MLLIAQPAYKNRTNLLKRYLRQKYVNGLQLGLLSSPFVTEKPIDTSFAFSFTFCKFMMQKSKILGDL